MVNDKIITFYETKHFHKQAKKLMDSALLDKLKLYLASNPRAGDVIPGSSGIRKIRVPLPNKGKQGGARVIYFYIDEKGLISLLTIYAKSQKENLDKSELSELSRLADIIRANV